MKVAASDIDKKALFKEAKDTFTTMRKDGSLKKTGSGIDITPEDGLDDIPELENDEAWACPACGNICDGLFCNKCGTRKPEVVEMDFEDLVEGKWVCLNCGNSCEGLFCNKCGTKRP